ncbi:hypothetical protein SAMN05421676_10783 [Salinibacillus kushneri]|uniref:Uncharacterized protein n=1 Tax=Salinibacillus kushneri TaxID=237682 RepID=A0A1I0GN70_9BACI|nr:hypothetical protein [Salinibacillus kushneri]SET72448.1 hypothetical protein SAMN05421676_10783 [Salinibacillus kushneri]
MRKFLSIWISCWILFICSASLVAAEQAYKYFSVGDAEISEINEQSYNVSTKGSKQDEGFVFTPKSIKGGKQITFQLDMKGKGEVLIRVSESDKAGKYIKESISDPIKLAKDWKTAQHNLMLSPKTAEIDIMVLTNRKQQATFQFKNVKVNEHKQPTL